MYRVNDIKTGLLHLVGWRQNHESQDLTISDSLTESLSGLYFQQAHPLLTLQNIKSIAPVFASNPYKTYSNDKRYALDERCEYKTKSYKALKAAYQVLPDSDTEYWVEVDQFSEWLENKTKDSIANAVSNFIMNKQYDGATKLLENKVLFDGAGRLCDTVNNESALVGFEIVPIRSKGVTLRINKIGLQFTEAGKVTLYLMHSSSSDPIRVIELVRTKANAMEWFVQTDLYLPYLSDDVDAGGSWYLMYNQSELTGNNQAIYKDRDWSKGPCASCSRLETIAWQALSRFLEVYPLKVSSQNMAHDNTLWSIEDNLYTMYSNYGINLEVSVECDITDFILEQKGLFQDIILKQVAVDILKEMAYNPNARINRNALNATAGINASKGDILYDLNGDPNSFKRSGLIYQLEKAYKAISLQTNGIDRICLPCKSTGVKYRTV